MVTSGFQVNRCETFQTDDDEQIKPASCCDMSPTQQIFQHHVEPCFCWWWCLCVFCQSSEREVKAESTLCFSLWYLEVHRDAADCVLRANVAALTVWRTLFDVNSSLQPLFRIKKKWFRCDQRDAAVQTWSRKSRHSLRSNILLKLIFSETETPDV